MSFKRVGVVLVLLGVLLAGAGSALAAKDSFIGAWKNIDPNGGLTRLVISTIGSHYFIQGYAACAPTECEWGATDLTFLAYSSDLNNFEWAMAIWEVSFKTIYLILHIQGDQMVVDSFNVYTPADGRTPFRSLYLLKKE